MLQKKNVQGKREYLLCSDEILYSLLLHHGNKNIDSFLIDEKESFHYTTLPKKGSTVTQNFLHVI